MARARTGTLIPPEKDGLWRARVTKTLEDGTVSRPIYSLGTTDKAIAKRKLAQLVATLAKVRGGARAVAADRDRDRAGICRTLARETPDPRRRQCGR